LKHQAFTSLTGKAADEIGGVLRKSASAQAGGRKPGFDSRAFFTLGRLHGCSLLAVLRRAVEGVPKAIERKNVRGMGTFLPISPLAQARFRSGDLHICRDDGTRRP
jgi:hypothetical protein